jgi:hypothetical protein
MSVDLEEAQDRLARNQDGGQGRSIRDSEDRSENLQASRAVYMDMMCLLIPVSYPPVCPIDAA